MIGGVITRRVSKNALGRLRAGFWLGVSVACLLILPSWQGECVAVIIAGREANRHLLPS